MRNKTVVKSDKSPNVIDNFYCTQIFNFSEVMTESEVRFIFESNSKSNDLSRSLTIKMKSKKVISDQEIYYLICFLNRYIIKYFFF